MKLERILQATAATISVTFTADGVAENPSPDDATVTLTRASDGTELGPYDAYDTGTGSFSHTLTPTETADLDTLTAAWTVTFDGYEQVLNTRIEVVGGFVFSLADIRAMKPFDGYLNDGTTYRYSTASLLAARNEVERALEQELCFAMVPRFSTVTLDGDGGSTVGISPYPRRIRSALVSDTALTPSDLSMSPLGFLYSPTRWASGFQNVTVGYEHGLDYPPPRAKDVALALAKRALTGSPADDRATSMSTEQETTQFYVPGDGEPFDVPAANRFVASNTLRTGIA